MAVLGLLAALGALARLASVELGDDERLGGVFLYPFASQFHSEKLVVKEALSASTWLNNKLYRMMQKQTLFSVPGRKGIYSLEPMEKEQAAELN